ncbi:MAG: SurA N-terminal domain-containing protein [Desulfobacterales bacterium]|nr:SurA N-terminal domain-containing protein [Desulfobacterales bacterium]
MLGYLRENTGNWIIKLFLGIIVLVFVFLGVGSFNSSRNNAVATINDQEITITEFQDAYRNMVEGLRRQFGNSLNDDLLKALNVKQQTLNTLIEQRLVDLEADRLDIKVSDEELQGVLLSIKAFQKNGAFDMELYKKVLGLNSMNPEIFEAQQREGLKQQKVRDLILSNVTVSDLEAEKWYRFENTKMTIEYLKVSPEAFSKIVATDDQIKAHYDKNSTDYKSEPQRRVAYLKFSAKDYADKVAVTDAQVSDYYQQNIETYKTPEKVEARHILIRVEEDAADDAVEAARKKALDVYEKAAKGEDFAELAKKYSQGPSKDSGGYLGSFARNTMVKPFADKAFAMKAGEISKPVRTQFGWHLIKVEARFAASVATLAEVKERIRKELASEEMQNMAYYKAGEAFDAVVDGDDFEQVALIAGKKLAQTAAFTRDGSGLDFEENRTGFAGAAFALSNDDISEVKQLGDTYYLIKVVERISPKVLPLDAVKEIIQVELTAKYRKEAAKKQAEALVEKAMEDKDLVALAKAQGLNLETSNSFTRNQSIQGIGDSQALVTAAFELTQEKPVYAKALETTQGYYIIKFKGQEVPADSEIAKSLEQVKSRLIAMKQRQYYQSWIEELKGKYTIEIDPNFIN